MFHAWNRHRNRRRVVFQLKGNNRYSHIDLLETIAIFFVIVYHSTLYPFDITHDGAAIYYARYYFRTILSTCVPLFFFANGYLLFNRAFDLRKHLRKMARLIILVFVWAFLLMPLYLLIAGEPLNLKTIILTIFELDIKWSMNQFWFLGALICIYIVFPALRTLFDVNKKAFWLFTITIFTLTFGFVLANQFLTFTGAVFHHNIKSIQYPIITMFNPFRGSYGYSFAYFCIGGLACAYEDRIRLISPKKRNIIACVGITVSCTLLFLVGVFFSKFYDGKMWDVVWNGYDSVFTFANVLFVYILCLNYQGNNLIITNISQNTLGLYFTHELIIRLTRPWIKTIPTLLYSLTVNLVYGFAIMCICLFICSILRKIPVLRNMI